MPTRRSSRRYERGRRRTEALRLTFHLAPPLLASHKATGEPRKMSFGPWMLGGFAVLAKVKFLRGTALDPFGYTAERQGRAAARARLEALLDEAHRGAPPENPLAVGLAVIPEKIRGFAASRSATSRPPRPTRPRCWSNSAPGP